MDRRNFLATAGAASLAAMPSRGMAQLLNKPFYQVVETTAGKLRGITVDGIFQFRGVPYGASTAGANRFMPPQPVAPWSGIRDAYGYGEISPQPYSSPSHPFGNLIDFDLHAGAMGEDCLNLNVWTPGLDGAKRPVIVYFHGGGLSTGSGNHDLYIGDRLARFADVVVVTVNHRLSALGYINLTDLGAPAEYADAGNAGILDLAQSLEWVRDNIAGFGGNPGNVMIFGQSGGGTKVGAVMGMERARGLYHSAAIQSGSLDLASREDSAAAAEQLLKALGIGKDWAKLQQLPPEALIEAQLSIGTFDWISGKPPTRPQPQFTAVLDGRTFTAPLADPATLRKSAHIPLIVGYCKDDAGWPMTNFDLTDTGLQQVAVELAGSERAAEAVQLYTEHYPNASPFLLQAAMLTDRDLLPAVTAVAERRAALGGKTYVYRFDWPSQAMNGVFGAVHGMDMCLVFHITHQATLGGDTPVSREMADKMATAWASFARTGDPNSNAMPAWEAYDATQRQTMVINHPRQRLVDDPNGPFRLFWDDVAKGPAKTAKRKK